MHTVKIALDLLRNTIIQFDISTLLNDSKFRKWQHISIRPIDGTLTRTTTPGQSGAEGESNESVFRISQSPRTEASPSDGLVSYPRYSLGVGSYPLNRDTVCIIQPQMTGQ